LSNEALILAALLLVAIGLLIALLLRRAPSDPALAMLQSAQERQGERLGAIEGNLRTDIANGRSDLAREVSGLFVEQTRFLTEQMSQQREALGRLERDLMERLANNARDALASLAEDREKALNSQDALRREVSTQLTETREKFSAVEKDLLERLTKEAGASRDLLDAKLKEMAENSEKRLADIQKSVNEQLASAVEKQMNESFQRVIDQFAAIQQMMGNVQSVATQVGDLKRLFGNIKTRGGWGEAQLKAMLDDFLPAGAYETNVKLREDSNDVVEFAILMPGGEDRARLPLDAKFPSEDYERLMVAHEAGDLVAETQARRAIEMRVRGEAAKIAEKYICPPRSTEYAILFLPTEGLYAEVSRIPGLIDDVARASRVFIAGPSLLPAMLKTIQLGYVSFALSKNAESVRELLSATKTEMAKMDTVLEKLGKQVGTVSSTIGSARVRTKAIARKLRGLEALPGEAAERLLEIEAGIADITVEGDED